MWHGFIQTGNCQTWWTHGSTQAEAVNHRVCSPASGRGSWTHPKRELFHHLTLDCTGGMPSTTAGDFNKTICNILTQHNPVIFPQPLCCHFPDSSHRFSLCVLAGVGWKACFASNHEAHPKPRASSSHCNSSAYDYKRAMKTSLLHAQKMKTPSLNSQGKCFLHTHTHTLTTNAPL